MQKPRSNVLLPTLRAVLSAGAAGAFGGAILDVTRATLRASEPVSGGAFVSALVASCGLYGAAAILFAIAAGIVAGAARATLPEHALRDLRERLRRDEPFDLAAAAGLLAVGTAALVLGAILFVFVRGFALEMASKRNGALSSALVGVAALPIAAAAFFPAYLALRPVARLLPRPRTLVAIGGIAGAGALAVVGAVASVDWRIINFGPFLAIGWFLALGLGHLAFWNAGRGARIAAKLPRAVDLGLGVGATAVLLLLFVVTVRGFGDEPRALALVAEETAGARPILRMVQKLADHDRDGYAAILGGGDCNDRDPAINPGATDEAGNGIDEDCSGADAKPRAARKVEAAPSAPAEAAKAFDGNLLVIVVDTLRADRLNERTMPTLSAFAKDAVVFENVYAQAPNTPRSFPSFITSRFPSQIKWTKESLNFAPITDENTTVFEVLREAGFRTIGKFSHFYLDPKTGVSQGFDEWDNAGALTLHDSNTDIAAPRITPKVVKRLRELSKDQKKFVLWTHYFEPHSRYMEHPEFPARGSGFKALESKYDGEVSFVDQHLKAVLDELRADGLDSKTAVIIFSDHGEAFGEHRFNGEQMFFHGQTLYDELLRVPLVVRVPGVPGRRVKERAMLVDVAPTLLDLVGVKAPASFQGRSLAPAIRGGALAEEPAYAELLPATSWQHSWRVLVDGNLKILDKISENTTELYDLAADPTEQKNLSLSSAAEAKKMKQALREYMSGIQAPAVKAAHAAPAP